MSLACLVEASAFDSPKLAIKSGENGRGSIATTVADDCARSVWINAVHCAAVIEHPQEARSADHYADVIELAFLADLGPLQVGRVGPIEIAILDRPKLAIHCRQISATFEVAFVDQRIVAALIGFPKRAVGFDRIKNSIQPGHRDGLTPSATFSGFLPFAVCRITLVNSVT